MDLTENGKRPFSAFGRILEQSRRKQFGTARSLFQEPAKLSFSYRVYAAFERGESLPTASQLIEIADLLQMERRQTLLLWVHAQMPEGELRDFVEGLLHGICSPPPQGPSEGSTRLVAPPSSMDNTWVLGPGDVAQISEEPWLWDLLTQLILSYPKKVSFPELVIPSGLSPQALIKQYLQAWIMTGTIVVDEEGLATGQPHLRLPESDAAVRLRVGNMRRAVDSLSGSGAIDAIREGRAYRKLHCGNLSEKGARKWAEKLSRWSLSFFGMSAWTNPNERRTSCCLAWDGSSGQIESRVLGCSLCNRWMPLQLRNGCQRAFAKTRATTLASSLFSSASAGELVGPLPGYEQKAAQVEAHYQAFTQSIARIYDELIQRTQKEAPAIYAKLKGEPPHPAKHGYQLLPKIVPGGPPVALEGPDRPRVTPQAYTWPWTDHLIEGEMSKARDLERRIVRVGPLNFGVLAAAYQVLEPKQRWLDSHVSYNRFWQAEVRKDRPRFDRFTVLYEKVLKRQAIHDAFALKGDPFQKKALELLGGRPETASGSDEGLRSLLMAREAELAHEIHDGVEGFQPPSFLKVLKPSRHETVIEVPVYTDIRDERFLTQMKTGIEAKWSVQEGQERFGVRLRLTRIPPEKLYGKEKPPAEGEEFDINRHVLRFPSDGAVITTGADSTYAVPGRYVALGSAEVSANVLAHEFGHILGFSDSYFRAYHDLGPDGLEVIEIIPDPVDIMCAPGNGRVLREHFDLLMAKLARSP